MKILFFIFGLLILSFPASAIPVSYKISLDYSGDITTGHVLKAVSYSKTTSKTVNANFPVINHVANEGEIVSFFLDDILFNNYTHPLPGSIVDLGVNNIEAPPVGEASAGGGGGGGGGGSTAVNPTINPEFIEEETLEETPENVAETVELDLETSAADFSADFSIAEGEARSFSMTGSSGGRGEHTLTVDSVFEDRATFTIESTPKKITLLIGEDKNVDVDDDSIDDISVALNAIIGKNVDVSIRNLIRKSADAVDGAASGLSKITGAAVGILGSKIAIFTYITVAALFLVVAMIVRLGGIYEIRRRLRREKKFPKIDYF